MVSEEDGSWRISSRKTVEADTKSARSAVEHSSGISFQVHLIEYNHLEGTYGQEAH